MAFYGKPDMGGGIPGAARNTMAKYPPNPSSNARMGTGRAVGGGAGNPPPPAASRPEWVFDQEAYDNAMWANVNNPAPPMSVGGTPRPMPGYDTGFMRPMMPGAGATPGGGYQPGTAGRGGVSFSPGAPRPEMAGPAPGLQAPRPGKAGGPPSMAAPRLL